jgi:hypothetical protein
MKSTTAFLKLGSDIVSAGASMSLANFIGGPEGVTLASLSAPVIQNLFKTHTEHAIVIARNLREETRLSFVLFKSINEIEKRLVNGDSIREDDFFEKKEFGRSSADELLDGILSTSIKEYQEKKLSLLSNFSVNMLFDINLDKDFGIHLIKEAESLSYRQFCLIAIFYKRDDFIGDERVIITRKDVLLEILNLGTKGLLKTGFEPNVISTDARSIKRNEGSTSHFYHMFGLDEIPEEDLMQVMEQINP